MSGYASSASEIIYAALNGNISATVYGDVPDQPPGQPAFNMPYVVIGYDQQFPFETDDWTGEAVTIEIRFYSAASTKKQVKDLQKEVYELLHRQALTGVGVNVNDCLHRYSNIPSSNADNYVLGISRYRLTLTEVI